MLRASAVIVTDAPSRYAKQLLAHLGHKVPMQPLADQPEPAGQLVFSYGIGTVLPLDGRLVLGAIAPDADSLAHVEDVLQRHLVKFGARRELVVTWGPAVDVEAPPDPETTTDTATTEPDGTTATATTDPGR